ncbi:RNA pseudouridine synthase [Rhodoferax koreense]|uniref:Dual-specificity RNA pseudouridine synthase RluA n=1 Tax=Rhodoferax koreensis TaxID=1842727 RepID=A0A1P8K3R0_9BURK|nr:RNA pseudouridine synthase [Rhodoferax koreense]
MPAVAPGTEVLFADDALIVLRKPSGLLAVPGRGADKQDCLSLRVQQMYPDALVVHRLDMATSGLMLMARGAAVQRLLNAAFAGREVHKRYTAVVAGDLPKWDDWREIDLPIRVDWPRRPLRIIDALQGKPSITRWRGLPEGAGDRPGTTRVELQPVTGRSHQLRVHLQALGHPILGDRLYASPEIQALSDRLLLHACALRLPHPVTGEPLAFEDLAPF